MNADIPDRSARAHPIQVPCPIAFEKYIPEVTRAMCVLPGLGVWENHFRAPHLLDPKWLRILCNKSY